MRRARLWWAVVTLAGCGTRAASPDAAGDAATREAEADLRLPPCGTTQLAAGGAHTCALRADGTVWCWGANNAGQLGDGTLVDRLQPTTTATLGDNVDLGAGDSLTCVRKRDGSVWCWGAVGSESDASDPTSPFPRRMPLPLPALQLAVGDTFACARLEDAAPWCWGTPPIVQSSRNPLHAPLLDSRVRQIWAGGHEICVLLLDNSVWCGGQYDHAFCPQGPLPVAPLTKVPIVFSPVQVVSGEELTCARDAAGSVWCWGRNDVGQLGIGLKSPWQDSLGPTRVTPLSTDAVDVTAGRLHVCARRRDGTLRCWGRNEMGQLGDGTFEDRHAPAAASSGVAISIAAGDDHTCAATTDGAVQCWGSRARGRLGDGTPTASATLVRVAGLPPVQDIVTSAEHTCATHATTAPHLWCWGRNREGQLGDGTRSQRPSAVPSLLGEPAVRLALSFSRGCAVTAAGRLLCWGSRGALNLEEPDRAPVLTPTAIPGLPPIADVALTPWLACALGRDGTVHCWGAHGIGPTCPYQPTPIQSSAPSGALKIAGGSIICLVLSDGSIACRNPTADPADPFTAIPKYGAGWSDIRLAPTYAAGCLSRSDGSLHCWGLNTDGEVGDGTTTPRDTPAPVILPDRVASFEVGHRQSCAALADGTVHCWGHPFGPTPIRHPLAPPSVDRIALGAAHTCFHTTAGEVHCVGDDAEGQLGAGTGGARATPQKIPGCP